MREMQLRIRNKYSRKCFLAPWWWTVNNNGRAMGRAARGQIREPGNSCPDDMIFAGHETQVKSKLAGPKAAPLGRKQMKCRILPDQLVYNVKNTKSFLNRIQ